MTQFKPFDSLVSLVGENPLPVYFGIRQFAAKNADIVLLHSRDTEEIAFNIGALLLLDNIKHSFDRRVQFRPLTSPFDPVEATITASDLRDTFPSAALNYTGGTKVMSAFSVSVWLREPQGPAFYLDDDGAIFRFTDGSSCEISGFGIDINELCALHGVSLDKTKYYPSLTKADIDSIWAKFNGSRPMPADCDSFRCLQIRKMEWEQFLNTLTITTQNSREWNAPFPSNMSEFKKGHFDRKLEAASTQWLEQLISHLVREMFPECTVQTSQHFRIRNQQFEADTVLMRNNRLYYFSASTADRPKRVTEKWFEAYYRARQMGGALARTAIVCLANTATLSQCRSSLTDDPRHRIFGVDDVSKWMEGDLRTLREFLER